MSTAVILFTIVTILAISTSIMSILISQAPVIESFDDSMSFAFHSPPADVRSSPLTSSSRNTESLKTEKPQQNRQPMLNVPIISGAEYLQASAFSGHPVHPR